MQLPDPPLRPGTQIGKAARSRASCLWVRLPPRSLRTIPWSNGKDAWVTTRKVMVRFHPGSLLQKWSVGVLAAHLLGKEEDRVRFPDGPLDDAGRWSNGKTLGLHPGNRGSIPRRSTGSEMRLRKVAGYGLPGRFAKRVLPRGDEGSTPLPSAWCAGLRAPMVKRRSCLASNEEFQVRLLVGVLAETVIYGVCGVAVAARLAVNQKVGVRLPPDTLGRIVGRRLSW